MSAAIAYRWTGVAMIPVRPALADKEFAIGEICWLDRRAERSSASHAHEFAWLNEAWMSLPEQLAELYATPEHLRKRALIQAGYYTEEIIDCSSNAAALRVAAFARKDEFAFVVVRGPIVAVRTAKSQSRRAMDRAEFQASKTAIMEVVASLIGVAPSELSKAEAA